MGTQIQGNTGVGQALAKLATAYVLRNGGKNLDAETATNRDQYNSELGGALNGYLAQREGTPGESMSTEQADQLLNQDQDVQLADPVKGNPRAAILSAMASKFPELQQIGKAEFAQLGKKPGFKDHLTQDGTLVRVSDGGEVQQLGNFAKPKDQYSDPYEMNTVGGGKILVKRNLATNDVEPVDKGVKVTTNVDTTGNKEALKKTADVLEGARSEQLTGIKLMEGAQRIDALANDPEVVTGFGAGPLAGLQNAAAKLGFTGNDGAAKTQALMSEFAAQTLEASKNLKGSISDKDLPFLREASGGNMNYTPEAIKHLAGLAKAVAHNQMINGRKQWESASTVEGADQIVKLYPQPEFGQWEMDGRFEPTAGGRVRYNGSLPGVNGAPAAGSPGPTGTPAASPRNRPLDGRIKFGS